MTDPISDLLTRIRNAQGALLKTIAISHSRMKEALVRILKAEGYLAEVAVVENEGRKSLKVTLKYAGKKGTIEGLRRISKPGLRRYVGAAEVPAVLGGMGISILSTSQGLMTGAEARKKNLGGELICFVW
jgi:small subunit ribosomal protein S8